jgi:ubiquinone/menaquinone biosynthesis C-methylase UbiE
MTDRRGPIKAAAELTAEEQTAVLADLYSAHAEAYDSLWSPVILPVAQRLLVRLPLAEATDVIDVGTGAGALLPSIRRAAPQATILGVDRSQGMLRLARKKHAGPLALMDAQKLELPSDCFDVAILAFMLFHVPHPGRCLDEVNRILRRGGVVGTVTWGAQHRPAATAIWDEELRATGAHIVELPAVENMSCCNSQAKVTALLKRGGFRSIKVWTEPILHIWRAEDHFWYQVHSNWREELESLPRSRREDCLSRVRNRLAGMGNDQYVFRGTVVMATAAKPQSKSAKVVARRDRGVARREQHV